MPIIGFNFNKLKVEKKSQPTWPIKTRNDFNIVKIDTVEVPLSGQKSDVLSFEFEYSVDYDPKAANILIGGQILYSEEPKKIKEIMSSWKKEKKLKPELMGKLINFALIKCHIKALSLSQDVNLPPHIGLPLIKKAEKPQKSDYIG
jgi:hypothetical protein